MILGAHESVAGGYHLAAAAALEDGAESVQIFVKNANRWTQRDITAKEAAAFRATDAQLPTRNYCAHASYLINLAEDKPKNVELAKVSLRQEVERCDVLGVPYVVLHHGSHVGKGYDAGIDLIAKGIDDVHAKTPDAKAKILLEAMAGQGTNVGAELEHLRAVIDRVDAPSRLGVCLDTCHLFAAGLDFRTEDTYAALTERLDALKLTSLVKVLHLNDSSHGLGSRKDRHANLGDGEIGVEPFRFWLNDKRWEKALGILETPWDGDNRPYKKELKLLRDML